MERSLPVLQRPSPPFHTFHPGIQRPFEKQSDSVKHKCHHIFTDQQIKVKMDYSCFLKEYCSIYPCTSLFVKNACAYSQIYKIKFHPMFFSCSRSSFTQTYVTISKKGWSQCSFHATFNKCYNGVWEEHILVVFEKQQDQVRIWWVCLCFVLSLKWSWKITAFSFLVFGERN